MKSVHLSLCLLFLSLTSGAQDLSRIGSGKPFSITGGLSVSSNFYTSSGIPARYPDFMYVLGGNISINIYDFSLPFSFTYGSQEKSYYQPFNQFGISPTYKWIKIHAGYRSMTFSPFTVSGTTFLGGGIELSPGLLRLGVLYGRFNRKSAFDSLRADYKPAYERMGFGARIGIGSEKNHVDIHYFKATDDTAGTAVLGEADFIRPAENVVLGSSAKFLFFKKLSVEADVAGSVYDRDRTAPRIEITEQNLKPIGLILPLGYATQFFTAAQSIVQYKAKSWSLKAQYQRIDPDYKSMGAAYSQTDIENITIGGSLSLWKRKIMLNGNIGSSHDNIKSTRSAQTSRTIGSVNLAFNPAIAYGMNFQYSNFGISQKAGIVVLNDSSKIVQNNRNIMLGNRYSIMKTSMTHTINLVINYQNMKDLNPDAVYKNEFDNLVITAGYLMNLKSGLSSGLNLTYTDINMSIRKSNAYTILLNAAKNFRRIINVAGNIGYTIASTDGTQSGNVITGGASASYTLLKKHQFRANFNILNNQAASGSNNKSYSEFRGALTYSYSF
ncbi:MAG: hypothetical protein AB9842_05285 [Bacteroidales bacterium]